MKPEQDIIIPRWIKEESKALPDMRRSPFADRSRVALLKLFSRMHFSGNGQTKGWSGAVGRVIGMILLIVLVGCARNMLFVYILMAAMLLRLCLLNGRVLRSILAGSMGAVIFTAIILLPAVFLGSPRTMLTVTCKVFFSVTLVNLVARTMSWTELTGALRSLFLPNLFIYIIDMALKYIDLSGRFLYQMLEALSLRLLGHEIGFNSGLGGVMGTTYLHTQTLAEEMYDAMRCRGFSGTYERMEGVRLTKGDGICLGGLALVVLLFIYLEKMI